MTVALRCPSARSGAACGSVCVTAPSCVLPEHRPSGRDMEGTPVEGGEDDARAPLSVLSTPTPLPLSPSSLGLPVPQAFQPPCFRPSPNLCLRVTPEDVGITTHAPPIKAQGLRCGLGRGPPQRAGPHACRGQTRPHARWLISIVSGLAAPQHLLRGLGPAGDTS